MIPADMPEIDIDQVAHPVRGPALSGAREPRGYMASHQAASTAVQLGAPAPGAGSTGAA